MPPIPQNIRHERRIAIIGAGPAGLMAAETLAKAGYKNITVYERKPSAARKFLMAGRGGLNITHSENFESFMGRYGTAVQYLRSALESFKPSDMREWCAGLGEETFIGTSGRVFPKSFKASPLLRAWIKRLSDSGVEFKMSCDWQGWNDEGNLQFDKGVEKADAVILALGGGSWAKLGSDGGWIKILEKRGIIINPLRPANSGFTVAWSEIFKNKFAGQPLKPVIATHGMQSTHSEIMISENGIEGGAIYALSAGIRDEIEKSGYANIQLDLHPDLSHENILQRLSKPRGRDSFTNYLRKTVGLSPVAIGLLYEADRKAGDLPAKELARLIKCLSLELLAPFPLDRAISSAGGISWNEIDQDYMLKRIPGVFAAGEMLDWEAPTGGYLLQATMATGVAAAHGIIRYLEK